MPLQIVKGDISNFKCDAIVSSTNKRLYPAGRIDRAICLMAGQEILSECMALAPCETGECVLTRGYNLPCRYVIHTVGPRAGDDASAHLLASCYKKAIRLAISKGCRSIAFPLMGSGNNGFSRERAISIAINRIEANFRSDGDTILVYLVLFDEATTLCAEQYAQKTIPNFLVKLSTEEEIDAVQKRVLAEREVQAKKREKRRQEVLAEKERTKVLVPTTGKMTKVPSSVILIAKLKENKTGAGKFVAVVSEASEQNSSKDIYWVGRRFSSLLLAAIFRGEPFVYENTSYTVEDVEEYPDAQKYINIIARFCDPQFPQTVYVFAHKHISKYDNENYETVTAMVPCANKSFPVPIPVYYEKRTRRYFMNEEAYTDARKKYGLPYLKVSLTGGDHIHGTFGTLKAHSELNLLGYSVSATNGMTGEARRALLRRIIDGGIMGKSSIQSHIEWLIHMNKNVVIMQDAVKEWEADLQFVSQYRMDKSRSIWVGAFKSARK